MAAATLDNLSEGRFVLGLGSSHRVQVGPEHGVTYQKPIQTVREAVEIVRTLLASGIIENYRGETVAIERFDFWFEHRAPKMPIYLSGLFPKMLGVCGEIADGVILTRTTLDSCADVRKHVRAGADRMGRDVSYIELTSLFPCGVGGFDVRGL